MPEYICSLIINNVYLRQLNCRIVSMRFDKPREPLFCLAIKKKSIRVIAHRWSTPWCAPNR